MTVPNATLTSNEPVLSSILDIGDQVGKIGSNKGQNAYRYNS